MRDQATEGKRKKIRVLSRKLGLSNDEMYAACGTDSLRKLSNTAALQIIEGMERELEKQGRPNLPKSRISGAQRALVLKYMHLLGWNRYQLWNWIKKVVGHDLPNGSNFQRFNWISPSDGRKIVEGLKAIYGKKNGHTEPDYHHQNVS